MKSVVAAYNAAFELYNRFNRHNGFLLSAGIAFFIFLSIFPLLIFVGIIISYALENPNLQDQVISYVFDRIPALTDEIQSTIEGLIDTRASAGVFALFGMLWAATGIFGGLSSALNAVYGVTETRNVIELRMTAIAVLSILFALVIISFATTSIVLLLRSLTESGVIPPQLVSLTLSIIVRVIGFASILVTFFAIYVLVPNKELGFNDVWPGTLFAGVVLELEQYALTFYFETLGARSYGLIYGSLATIIITLFWFNISSMLFIIGAEINALYKERTATAKGIKIFKPR